MTKPVAIRNTVIGEGQPGICVPIVGKTEDEIFREVDRLQGIPLDLAEWRADWYQDGICAGNVVAVLQGLRERLKDTPLLFTFRTKKEGGEKELDRETYLKLGEAAAGSGLADLIDLELFTALGEKNSDGKRGLAQAVQRLQAKGAKVVMSSHDFSHTPAEQEILKRLEIMDQAGADIMKIAVMPETAADVLTLLSATDQARYRWDKPLITMAMGGLGVVSRLSGETFGSAVTFASAGASSAPGQMDVLEVKRILDAVHRGMHPEKKGGHIFLIGFMGTGKSTVSAELSARCGYPALEMDQEIEKENGMEIRDIFSRYGEEYFRELETGLLKRISGEAPLVVSCGGGAVLREENVRAMKRCGRVVLLTASPETVLERVKGGEARPKLQGRMNISGISQLMQERERAYSQAADVSVPTDGRTPGEIAAEILRFLQ